MGDIIIDDENRFWVSTIPNGDYVIYEWLVFQDTGEWIATFKWPGNRSIDKIKDGYLYSRETDQTTGIKTIVKYRIELN